MRYQKNVAFAITGIYVSPRMQRGKHCFTEDINSVNSVLWNFRLWPRVAAF
jgi:hypothetical protein